MANTTTRAGAVHSQRARHRRTSRLRATCTSAESTTEPLTSWIHSCGGSVASSVHVASDPRLGGMTLVNTSNDTIKANTHVVVLPRSVTLSLSSKTSNDHEFALHLPPLLEKHVASVPEELWPLKLGLGLLLERAKGDSSAYAPYIRSLPSSFDGVPLFYNKNEIDTIAYPPVVHQVVKRAKFLHQFAGAVLADLQEENFASFNGVTVDVNAIGWAWAAISSRAFRVDAHAHEASALPLIDMCNHSFSPNCRVERASGGRSGEIRLVASKDIAANEPLTISYGSLSNDLLLLDYGFVVIPTSPDDDKSVNEHDMVELGFNPMLFSTASMLSANTPDVSEDLSEWQKESLRRELKIDSDASLRISADGSCDRLVAAARIMASPDKSSPSDEESACKLAASVLSLTLTGFETTAAEDYALLQDSSLSANARAALSLRIGKKLALARAIQRLGRSLKREAKKKTRGFG